MKNISIDFDFPVVDLHGKPIIPEQRAGAVLSTVLAAQAKGDPLKLWNWACSLAKPEPLSLDQSDYNVLYALVESSEVMTVLCKAQILHRLIESRETSVKGG